MIELHGLNRKQMVLADIMWAIDSQSGVERFIASLPKPDQRDCRTIIQLMQMYFADEVDSVNDAEKLLKAFQL